MMRFENIRGELPNVLKSSKHAWMMKWAGVLLIATFLRLWQIDSLPAELHRDEASIGYNAYSILLTGHDEHGVRYPFNFEAFGEYKLPGLIYLTVPFIHALDLTPLAVRLPTALSAILTIPAAFWLVRELGFSRRTAWITIILLTFSFWHISQARNAYEPMVGLLWSTTAFASWLRAQKKSRWLPLCLVAYAISCVFYNVPWILLPMLFVASSLIVHKKHIVKKISTFIGLVLAACVFVGIGLLLQGVNSSRSSVTIFNNSELSQQLDRFDFAHRVGGIPSPVVRIIAHPLWLSGYVFVKNYFAAFDPSYLFALGDDNPWHNLRSIFFGNENPVLLIPLVIGILFIVHNRKSASTQLLIAYLLLTPVVSSLTVVAPITNRLLDFHVAVIILAAVGIDHFLSSPQTWWKRIGSTLWMCTYLTITVIFCLRYFYVYNHTLDHQWYPGMTRLVHEVSTLSPQYSHVFVDGWELEYIFFAFHHPFPPTKFAQNAVRYPDGFNQVGRFEKISFTQHPTLRSIDAKFLNTYVKHNAGILIVTRSLPSTTPLRVVKEAKNHLGEYEWVLSTISLQDIEEYFLTLPQDSQVTAMRKYLHSCTDTCDPAILTPFLHQSSANE